MLVYYLIYFKVIYCNYNGMHNKISKYMFYIFSLQIYKKELEINEMLLHISDFESQERINNKKDRRFA